MADIIIIVIVAVVVGGAIAYIRKEKKRGVRCVGCSSGGSCGSVDCECNSTSCDSKER